MWPIQRGMEREVQGKVEIHNSTNFISGFSGHRIVLHIVQTNGIIARYLSWGCVNTPTKTVILIINAQRNTGHENFLTAWLFIFCR